MKVLITDHVPEEGIEPLRDYAQVDLKFGIKPEELIAIICDYDALLVRSQNCRSSPEPAWVLITSMFRKPPSMVS
jgi:metal-dependent amidase/aminoacylase/carboxypeptidase family protein